MIVNLRYAPSIDPCSVLGRNIKTKLVVAPNAKGQPTVMLLRYACGWFVYPQFHMHPWVCGIIADAGVAS
jgi:hypothetical protein